MFSPGKRNSAPPRLLDNRMIAPGIELEPKAPAAPMASPAYRRLEDVGQKLLEVIAHNRGGSNKGWYTPASRGCASGGAGCGPRRTYRRRI